VSIFRIVKKCDHYNICDAFRLILAALDVKLMSFIDDEDAPLHDGEVFINDMTNFGFSNVMQCISNISTVTSYIKYSEEAAPIRMKENHFVNCSHAFTKMMNFIKPILNKQVADSLNFHSSFVTLHEKVPKECLPEEFGGTAGKCDDLNKTWRDVFVDKR
jgi:hypothetical protein